MREASLVFDVLLILMAIGIVISMRGMGGAIGKSLIVMTAGIIVLGLAHILETLTFEVLSWGTELVELTHRLIVMTGFVLVFIGFRQIARLR